MTRSSMRRTKKIRASKDEQLQEDTLPLTQTPGFIIGMTFLGVVTAVIISVLIYRFIHRDFYRQYSKGYADRLTMDPTPTNKKKYSKGHSKRVTSYIPLPPLQEGGDGEG